MRILSLSEIEGQPVGGKAMGLARLRDMGLRVPDARVLVGAEPDETLEVYEDLAAELGGGAVAVRSSALGEDGEEASFAGQYETVLDVRGGAGIRAAVATCLRSVDNARATAYRDERHENVPGGVAMSIVVQRMIDPRVSGVCFTVDPVTSRRNRLVIDAVSGLGEKLVSGLASPDHEEFLREEARFQTSEPAGDEPILTPEERETIAREALEAETKAGEPLDLEWAIDRDGVLHWLQARPITTLAADPQRLDTPLDDPRDVHTRCNVGEMMPGAVSPLTYSTCARGIDVGWQRIKRDVGLGEEAGHARYIAMSHGHLFINMSEGARFSSAVSGAHPDQQSLALCGRVVPEVVAPEAPPLWVRVPRLLRQVVAMLRPGPRLRRMEGFVARGPIDARETSRESWQAIDDRFDDLFEAYQLHLVVSSAAGALAPILLARLADGGEPTDEHHAVVAAVLAGADDVESADIAAGAEGIIDRLANMGEGAASFEALDSASARSWLESDRAGEGGRAYRDYLERHGHRSLRELDVRQPEWAHDPTPLIRSLQAGLRGRRLRAAADGTIKASSGHDPDGAARFARIRPWLHAAVRNRERGKSLLVELTAIFKRAYRALGAQLVREGRLPDADAVYFLFHEELASLAESPPGSPLASEALLRRDLLAYQETLRFPEVAVGRPQPEAQGAGEGDERTIIGKPVSRGQVEGRVRVVSTLEEAEALRPGEILVAPITDVGWTPYFAIISGLVTDVGSAVSHGAVVAREYGLPAVLNTRDGTSRLVTGDRVRLDGDRGLVEKLD